MNTNQSPMQNQSTFGQATDGPAPTYVIQRSSETVREWWTGDGWSNDFNQAKTFDGEPDACLEADDEMAVAIKQDEVQD